MKTRRALLMQLAGRTPALRPPWTETDFAGSCTGCGDCISACPERVLIAGPRGIPRIDPQGDGCTRCGRCVEVCPEPVFDRNRPAFTWTARITDACLTTAGVHCRSCEESCPELAIRFRPVLGGVPRPDIDPAACSGCTACLPACPHQAIELRNAVETAA